MRLDRTQFPLDSKIHVERYPTVEAPPAVTAGQDFVIQVSLTEDLITPEVRITKGTRNAAGRLLLNLPEADSWLIGVAIATSPGLMLRDGRNNTVIELGRKGDSTTAIFNVTAQDSGESVSKVFVTFWYGSNFIAKVVREVRVVPAPTAAAPGGLGESATALSRGLTSAPPTVRAAPKPRPITKSVVTQFQAATLDSSAAGADLTLIVWRVRPGAESLVFVAGRGFRLAPEIARGLQEQTPGDFTKWLRVRYGKLALAARGVEKPHGESEAPAQSMALLAGFGRELWDRFAPDTFKQAYLQLLDKWGDNFQTIQIYSNDPAIPWELMVPHRPAFPDSHLMLGVRHQIARWHMREGWQGMELPPAQLAVNSIAVIVPSYDGPEVLPWVENEVAELRKFDGFTLVPGRFESMRQVISSPGFQIIHFAGHGAAREKSANIFDAVIRLEDGELDPDTWVGLVTEEAAQAHPLIFLNACETGRMASVANFVDGWAPALLDSGGSGYIGGLWPLGDASAARFSAEFYRMLGKESSAGQLGARCRATPPGSTPILSDRRSDVRRLRLLRQRRSRNGAERSRRSMIMA